MGYREDEVRALNALGIGPADGFPLKEGQETGDSQRTMVEMTRQMQQQMLGQQAKGSQGYKQNLQGPFWNNLYPAEQQRYSAEPFGPRWDGIPDGSIIPMGGQVGMQLPDGRILVEDIVKEEESPPWSQETVMILAMVVTAAVNYLGIKLILGVLSHGT